MLNDIEIILAAWGAKARFPAIGLVLHPRRSLLLREPLPGNP